MKIEKLVVIAAISFASSAFATEGQEAITTSQVDVLAGLNSQQIVLLSDDEMRDTVGAEFDLIKEINNLPKNVISSAQSAYSGMQSTIETQTPQMVRMVNSMGYTAYCLVAPAYNGCGATNNKKPVVVVTSQFQRNIALAKLAGRGF